MNTPLNNGGPAFPTHVPEAPLMADGQPSEPAFTQPGMTLRDWFAGRAMQASYLLHMDGTRNVDKTAAALASEAYAVADAMLAARNANPTRTV